MNSSIVRCLCPKKARNTPGSIRSFERAFLASETNFTVNEIEALFDLFKILSSSIIDDGLIHKEEFQLALFSNRSKKNLFADRLFNLFDIKHNGVIEFGEFVRTLSIFHPSAPEAEKVEFVFKLYDLKHTGYIERDELQEMVSAILNESDLTISDDEVEAIVDKTLLDADLKGDGKIDPEEWKEFIARNPSLLKNMTLPFLREISQAFPNFVLTTEVRDSELQNMFNDNGVQWVVLVLSFRDTKKTQTHLQLKHVEEFQLGLFGNSKKQSLFSDRMFSLFDSENNGLIGFGEFVRAAFQLYDIWRTGFIEREEVMELILALLDESDLVRSSDLIGAIIDKTFEDVDLKRDGKIDIEEWKHFVARNPSTLKNMTIHYLKDITVAFPSFVQKPDQEN